MKIIENTSFSFLGTRNYVNSTSIIEFVHDNIDIFIDGISIDYSLNIKMYKEMNVNCRVDIYNSHHEYINESIICEVNLNSDYDTKFIYFLSNNEVISNSIDDPVYSVNELSLSNDFSGHYKISSHNYNECIKNIIQSNKGLHISNIKLEKYRILNMFMKNIPVDFPNYPATSNIKITNIGVRETVNDGFSTLNKIIFTEMNINPILVGFQVVR